MVYQIWGGLEEQIQQSALTGIYPAVMPEVIIRDVPTNPNNVVVIVRVDESPQAPHAIQNSTRVYIRTGSITPPYELADINRIEYMFKRREDSQSVTRQILERIEKRAESSLYLGPPASNPISPCLDINTPNLTVTTRPVFPYRPVISTREIFDYAEKIHLQEHYQSNSISRVAGGVCVQTLARIDGASYTYRELNEHGVFYQKFVLRKIPHAWYTEEGPYLMPNQIVTKIAELVKLAQPFYRQCQYSGTIEVLVLLQGVFGETLMNNQHQFLEDLNRQKSSDSQLSTSTQYLPRDLGTPEKLMDVVDELASPLLWAFNIDVSIRDGKVADILKQSDILSMKTESLVIRDSA